jgi:hypothetical protein
MFKGDNVYVCMYVRGYNQKFPDWVDNEINKK